MAAVIVGVAIAAISAALAGCATVEGREGGDPADPFEPTNRKVLELNLALDRAVIKPVAQAYRDLVPEFVRNRIRAFLDNLAEPRVVVNQFLQGRTEAAGNEFARFFLNSTVGVLGLFDIASARGLPRQSGDFGQTLFAWGVSDGVYLVLPLFGPSNTRDSLGLAVDAYTTPPAHLIRGNDAVPIDAGVAIVDGIDLRARNIETLDELQSSALDFYSHLKSVVRQRRSADLRETGRALPGGDELTDPGASP